MEYPRLYDQDMKLLAVLENAVVGYTLKNNDLSTATVSLPTPDEKNAYMIAHNIVRIYDGDEEVGLFRIVGEPESSNALEGWTDYDLEHVIATLVDDVLFGYHEIGGTGIYTRNVAEYILSQQETTRWQLGQCDYADQYAYKFENTNLLAALFSLGNVLTDDYQFTFDTTTTPWTVNLIRLETATECEIRYRRNMQEISRTMDASALVTRLYLLGYGEGVNQLTVKSVNGGLPYIEADTKGKWRAKSSVYADTTIEDPALLLARGWAVLEELKNPYIAYVATAIDLYRLTGLEWDKFMPGKMVHAWDEPAGIDFTARIVTKRKPDVYGDPGNVELEIANRVRDIADSINKIAERQGIAELYSQGATNLYSQQYADNADGNHPAVMRFYVPSGCVRINSVRLSWELGAFRAYETGAAAGGGTTVTSAGGGATTKTSSGGGATTATSESGGGATVTEPQRIVSTTSEAGLPLAPLEYTHMPRTGGSVTLAGAPRNSTDEAGAHTHTGPSHKHAMGHFHYGPSHTHTGPSHNHAMGHFHYGPSHTHTGPSHHHTMTHYHYGDSHTHTGPSHYHTIDSHAHGFTHYHYAPSHRHSLNSHTHSLNGHLHSVSVDYIPWSGNTGTNSSDTGSASGNTGYGGVDLTGSPTDSDGSGVTYTGGSGQLSSNYAGTGSTGSGGGGLTGAPRTYDGSSLVTNTGDGGTGNTGAAGDGLTSNAVTNGGNSRIWTENGGTGATGAAGDGLTSNAVTNGGNSRIWTEDGGTGDTSEAGAHTHGMAHVHEFDHIHRVVVDITIPSFTLNVPAHTHSVSLGNHTHSITLEDHAHDVTIGDHSHDVTIGDHTHDVTLQAHTHEIVYGIYEGGTARNVTIKVDGVAVPDGSVSANEMDVVAYLSKDDAGKIHRGTWHTIEIVPDGLTRIEANLFVQAFVQSVGGGDY